MLGGPRCAPSSRAATRRSRAGPDANTTRHGWMLEFEGACTARARASSTNFRGTGLDKNSRVEWRSMIICSRSSMVAPPGEFVIMSLLRYQIKRGGLTTRGGIFTLVRFDAPVGKLAAYLSPSPFDGRKHPAIIWITSPLLHRAFRTRRPELHAVAPAAPASDNVRHDRADQTAHTAPDTIAGPP